MKLQKKSAIRGMAIFILVGLLLAACAPGSAIGPAVPTQSGPATPTPAPTSTVMDIPTGMPASTPTGASTAPQPAVAITVQQNLAKTLNLPVDQIKVVSVEPVDWPDSCLGVQKSDVMCAQMVTAGYRIVLEAGGKTYEYHTNETGGIVIQATAPLAQPVEKVMVWEQTENNVCNRVEIGSQDVSYGACSGTMQMTEISGLRVDELSYLASTYASFTAETKAGSVQFTGQGQQEPTDAEKRSITEWARLVFMESQGGRSGAAWGMAFSWHREGGIAGFCDDLTVYLTGWGMPTTCKSGQARAIKEYRLSASELDQMYTWIDQFANFDYEQKDAATADAMLLKLSFEGKGAEKATTAQQEQIAGFAGQISANASK